MLLLDLYITVLCLKSLSKTQSYLKYTHVYLYLNHANSLTNYNIFLAFSYLEFNKTCWSIRMIRVWEVLASNPTPNLQVNQHQTIERAGNNIVIVSLHYVFCPTVICLSIDCLTINVRTVLPLL